MEPTKPDGVLRRKLRGLGLGTLSDTDSWLRKMGLELGAG